MKRRTYLVATTDNVGVFRSTVVAVAVVARVPLRSLIKPYLDRILLQRPRLDSLVLVMTQAPLIGAADDVWVFGSTVIAVTVVA